MRKAINSSDYSSIHRMASVQLPGGSEEYCMRVDSTKFFCSAHRQYILLCDMYKILQGNAITFVLNFGYHGDADLIINL